MHIPTARQPHWLLAAGDARVPYRTSVHPSTGDSPFYLTYGRDAILPQDLTTLGAIGLAALDFITKGQRAPDDWKTQQLASLQQIEKPKGQLLLMPASSVQKLVEAASIGGACSSQN